jgi:myo-inositol-1(or 4)-monophosphatase
MQALLKTARQVAIEAAIAAGQLAKEHFTQEKQIVAKGEDGDLVTAIDHLAEKEILSRIMASFPDHQIRSEETGWSGAEGDWLWLVDPLDGTNNYAIGLPVYGVSLTLLYRKEPMLGVIYDSHLGNLYVAEKGKGAVCNDRPVRIKAGSASGKWTVGWVQGHLVQKNERAMRLKQQLDAGCKRMLRLWAPSLLWCMLARGDVDGIVLYNSEGDDLYSGILMAKEAGAAVVDFEGAPFEGMNPEPYIIACHPDRLPKLLEMVRHSLQPND